MPSFEAECVAGLEQFAAAELAALGAAPVPARAGAPHPPTPAPARGGEAGRGGRSPGVVVGEVRAGAGAVPFDYDGPWPALLGLRTVVAVHALLATDLPRPAALLDDGTFRRIVATVGHIRSLFPAGAFRTYRLSAAGADSPAFRRVLARLEQATGLRSGAEGGDLLLRFRRGADGRFALLARISPRPLAARAWRTCNRPGALNAAIASIMAGLTEPAPTDVYLNLACGSGTLLIERALLGPAGRLVGCDPDAEALACAARNVAAAGLRPAGEAVGDPRAGGVAERTEPGPARPAAAGAPGVAATPSEVELTGWDATSLPLPAASVDALTVDLPFGQLVGSHAGNADLYPAVLAEAARVARPGARLVAITQQVRLFERSVDPACWATTAVYRPTLSTAGGPIKPGIFVLRRPGGSPTDPSAPATREWRR